MVIAVSVPSIVKAWSSASSPGVLFCVLAPLGVISFLVQGLCNLCIRPLVAACIFGCP